MRPARYLSLGRERVTVASASAALGVQYTGAWLFVLQATPIEGGGILCLGYGSGFRVTGGLKFRAQEFGVYGLGPGAALVEGGSDDV